MQYGIFLELQLPRPWRQDSERELFENALEWVRIADRIGISYVWAQEHHFLEEYSHSTAPEVFLAACTQMTERIRFGFGITVMPPAFNHPVRVAERIATMDLVSRGRVEWGTGESSSRLELEGFRVPYIEKRAMWAEAVRECAKMMCSEPYGGYEGRYFSMPPRNIVPKPVQRPHPPAWVACTNRDTLRLAARLGLGALTFSFMDAGEARFWIEEYYETFERDCAPITQSVNPNVAMLGGLMCHPDGDVARKRGIEGQQFFAWALAHYYQNGTHRPGRTNLWQRFKEVEPFPMAGLAGVGTPEEVREKFEELEEVGLDQLILLQQGGRYEHEHICDSLELFGKDVLPIFLSRDDARQRAKRERLASAIERAMGRVPPLGDDGDVEDVKSYGALWDAKGADPGVTTPKRALDAARLWRLHVGGWRAK